MEPINSLAACSLFNGITIYMGTNNIPAGSFALEDIIMFPMFNMQVNRSVLQLCNYNIARVTKILHQITIFRRKKYSSKYFCCINVKSFLRFLKSDYSSRDTHQTTENLVHDTTQSLVPSHSVNKSIAYNIVTLSQKRYRSASCNRHDFWLENHPPALKNRLGFAIRALLINTNLFSSICLIFMLMIRILLLSGRTKLATIYEPYWIFFSVNLRLCVLL